MKRLQKNTKSKTKLVVPINKVSLGDRHKDCYIGHIVFLTFTKCNLRPLPIIFVLLNTCEPATTSYLFND